MRRYRTMVLAPETLARMIGVGTNETIAVEAVTDLKIIAIRMNHWLNLIELLVSSESFDEVPESQEPPTWTPSFTTVTHQ